MESSQLPPYVRVSDISEASNSGSVLPIRAPLTPDSDSNSETELGYVTSSSNISLVGDESETASFDRYEVHWSYVSDPDEHDDVGRAMVGGLGEDEVVCPIANVSWESDGSEVEEGGGLLGHVKALVCGFVEKVSIAPRVKVSEFEEDGDEDESLDVRVGCGEDCSFGNAESRETKSDEMDLSELSVLEGGEGGDCVQEESFVHGSLGNSEELDVEGNEDQSYVTAESSDTSSVELSVDVVEGGGKNKYVEDEYLMGKIYEKLEKLDIVESDENQSTGDCHVSEAVFNSITPRSVLGENVATGFKIENPVDDGKGLVSFGDAALQSQDSEAEVKMSFKEKGSTDEQDLTRLPLYAKSVPHGIKICEIEEEEAVTGKDSNSCVKLFETAAELKGVDNSDLVSIAEESIMQCSNIKCSDVDICQNYGASSSEVYSVCDSDFEGSKDQITNSETCAEPNPILNILYLGKRNLPEAAEDNEYILCSDFLDLITPSSTATVDHIFGDKTRVQSCKIGRRISGASISHLGDDATTGLKIEDRVAVGKHIVLAGSAGAVQRQCDAACGAKLELRLKEKHFPLMQDKTSFGMSLMKWSGGLVLATEILSKFCVGNSEIAVRVVLDNKQRGKISIRSSNSEKIQSAGIIGILSVAASVFGFCRSRFNVQNSR